MSLIQNICPKITAANIKAVQPDLRISKTSESSLEAAIGYVEAKDLGDDLDDKKIGNNLRNIAKPCQTLLLRIISISNFISKTSSKQRLQSPKSKMAKSCF